MRRQTTRIQRPRRGFTIIELMVAIGVASLMLFLINFIFNDAVRAVSRGIALSDIISSTRGGGDQFEIDADVMVGPEDPVSGAPGGFLIIGNYRVANVDTRRGQRLANVPATVRTDQLVFVRLRDDGGGNQLLSVSPESFNTFSADFARSTGSYYADHVKIWYGTLRKTNPDGTTTGVLGSPPNNVANDWILGRQAVFLVDESQGEAIANFHADTARYNSAVTGYGGATLPAAVPQVMYSGLTDMADETLADINTYMAGGTYTSRAYEYAYFDERLRANVEPQIDTSNLYGLASWQVAQMHPVFLPHASDFIVEFAADADLDGEVDTDDHDSDPTTPEIIKWYCHDGYANEPGTGGYDANAAATYPLPAGAYKNAVYDGTGGTNRAGAFVWRHNDTNAILTGDVTPPIQPSYWPYLIRIRYRMHDSRGTIESGNNQHGVWFEHVIKVNRP